MMKWTFVNITFLLMALTTQLSAQTTLEGYITQYEHGDTIIDCKVYNRKIVYNKHGDEIHREWQQYSLEDAPKNTKVHFVTTINNSDDYTFGWETKDEKKTFTYINDTVKETFYMLEGNDTIEVYKVSFDEKGRLTQKTCLKGCDFSNRYSYSNPMADTMTSTTSDGTVAYLITEYDSQHRRTLSKYNLESPTDEDYTYTKVKYKDQVNMEVIEMGSTTSEDKEVNTIFFNKKGFPIYETIEIYSGDDKIRWVIEYEQLRI